MSTVVEYDPALFVVERAVPGAWVAVPLATFTLSSGYRPDDNNTLIIDAETATVSLSFWDTPGDVLYPGDRVRASYDGKTLFLGTVESTTIATVVDPHAAAHGAARRVDFSAAVAGTYAIALSAVVTWTSLPEEPAITRIRRWVTVTGWTEAP